MSTELEEFTTKIKDKIAHQIGELPQEAFKNHMLVGGVYKGNLPKVFYKPHNYRLYFDFNSKKLTNPKTHPKGWVYKGIVNSKEHLYTYRLFNLRVKKNTIEVQNKDNRWFPVELSTKSDKQIKDIIEKKDEQCIRVLKAFIHHYGGSSNYIIKNRHSEDKVTAEDKIDLIPIKQKWHSKEVKKVYNEPNVEFSSPAFAANYIRNRAIENIAPEIMDYLYTVNPLRALKLGIKEIRDIFLMDKYIQLLNDSEMHEFSDWVFDKFKEK